MTLKVTGLPQAQLRWHYHANTKKTRKARTPNRVHASDLDPNRRWCGREVALLNRLDRPRPDERTFSAQQFAFRMGYAAADEFIAGLPQKRVWGGWRCRACGGEMLMRFRPETCESCGARGRALDYREVLLQDPESKIVGSCDLMFDLLGVGSKTLVEIKSESAEAVKSRTAPDNDHVWRTRLYLYLASKTPWLQKHGVNVNDARIIYIAKNGHYQDPEIKAWKLGDSAYTPFREFVVNRSDENLTGALERVAVVNAWKAEQLPLSEPSWLPERVCHSADDGRARRCSVRDECFYGKTACLSSE